MQQRTLRRILATLLALGMAAAGVASGASLASQQHTAAPAYQVADPGGGPGGGG